MKNEKLDLKIDNICTELKRLIAIEYGEASVDELIKLSSFNKLNLTNKEKIDFLNYISYLTSYLTIQEYINYVLTLVQLLVINPKLLSKIRHLNLILNIFNRMPVKDYEKNLELFTDTKLLNHISKLINANEVIDYLVMNYKNADKLNEMITYVDGVESKNENRRL